MLFKPPHQQKIVIIRTCLVISEFRLSFITWLRQYPHSHDPQFGYYYSASDSRHRKDLRTYLSWSQTTIIQKRTWCDAFDFRWVLLVKHRPATLGWRRSRLILESKRLATISSGSLFMTPLTTCREYNGGDVSPTKEIDTALLQTATSTKKS